MINDHRIESTRNFSKLGSFQTRVVIKEKPKSDWSGLGKLCSNSESLV